MATQYNPATGQYEEVGTARTTQTSIRGQSERQRNSDSPAVGSREYWLRGYYDDYVKQITAAGGTPESRAQWELSISGDAADIDPTAKAKLKEDLATVKAKNEKAQEKADLEALLNQARIDRQGLLTELEGTGKAGISKAKTARQQRLSELASLLQGVQERAFAENTPTILEDLSARDLLHSSAVGENLAKEKSRLSQITSDQLRAQSLQDLNEELRQEEKLQDILGGIKTSGYGSELELRTGGLKDQNELARALIEREFSSIDNYLNNYYANKSAKEQAKAMQEAGLYSLAGQLVGAGTTAYMLKK